MHGLKVKTGVIWVSPLAMADWKDVLDRLLKEVQDSWNITWTDASMGVDPPKGMFRGFQIAVNSMGPGGRGMPKALGRFVVLCRLCGGKERSRYPRHPAKQGQGTSAAEQGPTESSPRLVGGRWWKCGSEIVWNFWQNPGTVMYNDWCKTRLFVFPGGLKVILGVLFSGVYHIYNQKHSWVIFYIYTYIYIYIYIYPIDSNRCGITGIPASFLSGIQKRSKIGRWTRILPWSWTSCGQARAARDMMWVQCQPCTPSHHFDRWYWV